MLSPQMKGRRPFIACDDSRFHNGWGRMTLIIMVSVYSILRREHWLSRSPYGSLEWDGGKGVPPFAFLFSWTQLLDYSEIIKIAFQIIDLIFAKIIIFFKLSFRYVSFLFRSCLRTRGRRETKFFSFERVSTQCEETFIHYIMIFYQTFKYL